MLLLVMCHVLRRIVINDWGHVSPRLASESGGRGVYIWVDFSWEVQMQKIRVTIKIRTLCMNNSVEALISLALKPQALILRDIRVYY